MSESSDPVTDIEYRNVGGQALLGRLYRSPDRIKVPLILDVHGGGWTSGDRTNNEIIAKDLVRRGIAVFSIDFRMPPEARYPSAIQDVAYAISWLKRNNDLLGLDPTSYGGIGTSSGGHLLLTALLKPSEFAPNAEDVRQINLDFAIACWPVADPLARYKMATKVGLQNLIRAHAAFWPDEQAMQFANPYLILERGEAEQCPPLLVLQGTSDENVEFEKTDQFIEAYRSKGGQAEIRKYAGAKHAFITREPESQDAIAGLNDLVKFVVSQNELKR